MGGFVNTARMIYDELGFDTLPLQAGSKKTIVRAWQNRPMNRLWQKVPNDANIGIRGGGLADVAIIDCDECRTFETVTNWLTGLGYWGDSYPVVQTASGEGRHIYLKFTGGLSGDWRVLDQEIGAGEFRYGAGSYVVAPPSIINNGGLYALLSGDFSILPSLDLSDIIQIVGNKEIITDRKPTLSRKAVALLNGKNIESYKSRSEAEQSLLASLANSGFSFVEVLDLFNRFPCAGKYAELKTKNPRNAERWLSKSYQEAVRWANTHESKARQIAKAAITWAESTPWQGRTGAVDRLVYIAHAEIAYKAGRLIYAAACRDLAERAGIGFKTALRATYRLCETGLIVPEKKGIADSANVYQIRQLDKVTHSPSTSTVRKCVTMSEHDVFRFGGLGKSAGEVYAALQEQPATVDELAEITGRHIRTIQRAINRMANLADPLTGEYLPMIASDEGEIYQALPVDLDRIAHAIGKAGVGERQRKQHAKERRLHARSLLMGQRSRENQPSSGDEEKV